MTDTLCSDTTSICAEDPEQDIPLAPMPENQKYALEFFSLPEVGQDVLLVTEHNVEINAGYIVLFGSKRTSIVTEAD